ncbi:MAG TPA: hypothetical protein PKA29_03225 [Candidatus Saccharibacteria bacterium]|nr:hypothetical protein [Candidatus Saccharibacteria bacterium]
MAVSYQYQNEYSKKEDSKSIRKKMIILGVGVLFLAVIAIIGMPKKEEVVPQTNNQIAADKGLEIADGLNLTDKQKAIKLNSDGFLIAVKNGSDYKSFTATLVYGVLHDNPSILSKLKEKDIKSCKLKSIEDGPENSLISIATYSCTKFYIMLSTSDSDDQDLESNNKVISWKILEMETS